MNFSTQVYLPSYDMFAVTITINPLVSQPGQPAYSNRGIYDTNEIDVIGIDGSIISEQKTELDIRETEFTVLPVQGDRVTIPFDCNGAPLGEFEIIDADTNGGGETTLTLRKWEPAKP